MRVTAKVRRRGRRLGSREEGLGRAEAVCGASMKIFTGRPRAGPTLDHGWAQAPHRARAAGPVVPPETSHGPMIYSPRNRDSSLFVYSVRLISSSREHTFQASNVQNPSGREEVGIVECRSSLERDVSCKWDFEEVRWVGYGMPSCGYSISVPLNLTLTPSAAC